MEEERTGRAPRGKRCTERGRGLREARLQELPEAPAGPKGGRAAGRSRRLRQAAGGTRTEAWREHGGAAAPSRERVPARRSRSGSASRVGRAQRAFPDTPPGRLKGPARPPGSRPPGARVIVSPELTGVSAPVPTVLPSSSGNSRRSGKDFQVLEPRPFPGRLCHSPRLPHCLFPWPLQIG